MYVAELEFSVTGDGARPSVEVLESAVRGARFVSGEIQHMYISPRDDKYYVVAFIYARDATEADLIARLGGEAASAAITALVFVGCSFWKPR